MCGLLDGDPGRADVLVTPIIKTFMSSSFNAPRIETAQLDEVQTKRLDLRQHAVERGPIQNTCQQRVFTLQLGHRRLKGRQGGRAKVAGDPNRVQPRNLLVHVINSQDSLGESASPGSSEVSGLPWQADGVPARGAARPRSTSRVPIVSRSVGARPESPGTDEHDSPGSAPTCASEGVNHDHRNHWSRLGRERPCAEPGRRRRAGCVGRTRLSRAAALANNLGPLARSASASQAIADPDTVAFTVWLDTLTALVAENNELLKGKVVVDPTNPLKLDANGTLQLGRHPGTVATRAHFNTGGTEFRAARPLHADLRRPAGLGPATVGPPIG
jgi:hypothetical protein